MLDKGFKPTVIALGYFDSVHLGHQKLIKLAKEYADKHGCTLTVFTFLGNVKAKLNKKEKKVSEGKVLNDREILRMIKVLS